MYQKLSYYPPINLAPQDPHNPINPIFLLNFPSLSLPQNFLPLSTFYDFPIHHSAPNQPPSPNHSEMRSLNVEVGRQEEGEAGERERQGRNSQRNLEKEIKSAKKNSESNIINQFFSFYGSRGKSEKKVEKVVSLLTDSPTEREKIIMVFYLAMKCLSVKRKKRYINKSILFSMFESESLQDCEELNEKAKNLGVSLEDLEVILRRCTSSFLKSFCSQGIMTSKRIGAMAKFEHLRRRRSIISTFFRC